MSRVLLDENIPIALRTRLGDHDVSTVNYLGWKGLSNGRLLDAAEAAGFDVLVSADQNIRFQQSIAGRSLAVICLSTTRWQAIRNSSGSVRQAIDQAVPGNVYDLKIVKPAAWDRNH